MRKYLFIFIFIFLSLSRVNAASCDAYDIKRLKEIADGVEITYELQEPFTDIYGDVVNDSYNIYINGLNSDFYFKFFDIENGIVNFERKNIVNNETIKIEKWVGGNYRIDVYSKNCNILIDKIEVILPKYNIYSENSICKDLNDKVDVCDKWYSGEVNEKIIQKKVEKYKNDNKSFFEKYWFLFVFAFLIIIGFLIVKIVARRREVF